MAAPEEEREPDISLILTVLRAPTEFVDWIIGESEYAHDDGADCVTVNVCPAMVIVPVSWLVVVLAATVKATVPFPVPLLPEVIVIQLALLVAVQLQPLEVVTPTLPVPPVEPNDWPVGEIEYVHDDKVNVAVTVWVEFMVIVQVPVPEQPPPDQPPKMEPESADALSVIDVPPVYVALQVEPQLMPPEELVTVPEPVPDLEIDKV